MRERRQPLREISKVIRTGSDIESVFSWVQGLKIGLEFNDVCSYGTILQHVHLTLPNSGSAESNQLKE
ncbi:hypothetical protein MTR_4g032005 [Medicago truncatula]|uniref:Uncharacterized protein n=1 Tax=Medicago truncatula TaxID=3880 RepID=A0A072UJH7_MEDTR|nr:hypothetical protein MTR_4g032005 [Medicago truncatula]